MTDAAEAFDFVEVCRADELQPGDRLRLNIDDLPIVLFRLDDTFHAIADACTHDNGPLGEGVLDGCCHIVCPRHGAIFDIITGQALRLPAVTPLDIYPVKLIEDSVMIGLPKL